MKDKAEDTPPPSPGVGSGSGDDDEMFADEIEEEVDVLDGEAEVFDLNCSNSSNQQYN